MSHSQINPALLASNNSKTIDIFPPPQLSYQSRDDLYRDTQQWAADHGYAISTLNSTTHDGEDRNTYACDKSGSLKPTDRDALRKTQKTAFHFKFTGNLYKKKTSIKSKSKTPTTTIPLQKIHSFNLLIEYCMSHHSTGYMI